MPALLRDNESLDSHWEELVYSEATFLAGGHKAQAASTAKALKQLDGIQGGQRAAWRREIVAQALVDFADEDLDEGVEQLGRDLLHLEAGNRKASRFKQYFKTAVSAVTRLGLESQIPVVEAMVVTLGRETEKQLKEHAKKLLGFIKRGKEAVDERRTAAAERGAHRAQAIIRFVDDINALRTSQHAEITLEAAKAGKPRDYADRFFRRQTRTARPVPGEVTPTPT